MAKKKKKKKEETGYRVVSLYERAGIPKEDWPPMENGDRANTRKSATKPPKETRYREVSLYERVGIPKGKRYPPYDGNRSGPQESVPEPPTDEPLSHVIRMLERLKQAIRSMMRTAQRPRG